MKMKFCFGHQDCIEIPCSPKEVGGIGFKCRFQKECHERTFEGFK